MTVLDVKNCARELLTTHENYKRAQQKARKAAPSIFRSLRQEHSIREIAKKLGKSASYISLLANSHLPASDAVFLSLAELVNKPQPAKSSGKVRATRGRPKKAQATEVRPTRGRPRKVRVEYVIEAPANGARKSARGRRPKVSK